MADFENRMYSNYREAEEKGSPAEHELNSWNISGEPAWVRPANPRILEDVKRYFEIDNDPHVIEMMVGDPVGSIEEAKALIKDRDFWLLYAVSGEKDEGDLAGFVSVYAIEEEVRKLSVAAGLLDESLRVWEVSYARYPDKKNKKEKGLISSGLRQICYFIGQHFMTGQEATSITNQELTIVAYTNSENKASERVLEAAGFVKKGEVDYLVNDKDEQGDDKCTLWVLDWQKLIEIIDKKSKEVIKKIYKPK